MIDKLMAMKKVLEYFDLQLDMNFLKMPNKDVEDTLVSSRKKSHIAGHFACDVEGNYPLVADLFIRFLDESSEGLFNSFTSSYCSIYRVVGFNNGKLLLRDILLNLDISVRTSEEVDEEYIFARLVLIDGEFYFLQKLNTMSSSFTEKFLDRLYGFFRGTTGGGMLESGDILYLLKKNLMDIFYLYGKCLKEYVESEMESIEIENKKNLSNELFSNESILEDFLEYETARRGYDEDDIGYYLNFFHDYYFDEDRDYFNNPNFKELYRWACEDGFILNDTEFINSINILTDFYKFINVEEKYNRELEDLEYVSENIFLYKNILCNSIEGFYFNEEILDVIYDNSLTAANSIVNVFEEFLHILEYSTVYISKTDGRILPSIARSIAEDLNLTPSTKAKATQKDYPLIEYFFRFLLEKNLCEIGEDLELKLSPRIYKYLSLFTIDKLALWIYSVYRYSKEDSRRDGPLKDLNKIFSGTLDYFSIKNIYRESTQVLETLSYLKIFEKRIGLGKGYFSYKAGYDIYKLLTEKKNSRVFYLSDFTGNMST